MGKFDGLLGKAKELATQNKDKIEAGLGKAGELVDRKTGGKHHDKIEKGLAKANEGLDKFAPDQPTQAGQADAPAPGVDEAPPPPPPAG